MQKKGTYTQPVCHTHGIILYTRLDSVSGQHAISVLYMISLLVQFVRELLKHKRPGHLANGITVAV